MENLLFLGVPILKHIRVLQVWSYDFYATKVSTESGKLCKEPAKTDQAAQAGLNPSCLHYALRIFFTCTSS